VQTKDQVIRDPSDRQVDLWRVIYQGGILPIEWQSKGAAEIHLQRCQAAGRALA
jgi:hypothetical protein